MFFGSIPALVTPFSGGRVAEDTFAEFVEWQIAEGSNALVPCGTTGESATLSADEHRRGDRDRGRGGEGTGSGDRRLRQSINIAHAIELIRDAAKDVGADAALDRPALLQPAEPGRHGRRISRRSPMPRRCRSSSTTFRRAPSPTFRSRRWPRLRKLPNIVGVKDATGNLGRVSAQRLACGEDFIQLSGNDDMALGFNAMGGVGCISVTANVAPQPLRRFPEGDARGTLGRSAEASGPALPAPRRAVHRRFARAGQICAVARPRRTSRPSFALPMVEPSDASKRAVDAALEHAGLI